MSRIKKSAILFAIMIKIGAFTFGGGIAMLALFENEFVTKRHYLQKEEFLDLVAIAESTPGPIAINAATYIGYKQAGVIGALMSTFGVVIPSFLIIFTLSLFLDNFFEYRLVEYAFRGIRICVIYLIFSAGIKMLKAREMRTPFSLTLILFTLLAMLLLSFFSISFSSIIFIVFGGLIGLATHGILLLTKRSSEENH